MASEPSAEGLDGYLTTKPSPLVALVGLQQLHGSLTERHLLPHPDELTARYISLDIDTKFLDHQPGSGEDHQSVILKRNWLHKHTNVTAAVVCLWFDFASDTSTAGLLAPDATGWPPPSDDPQPLPSPPPLPTLPLHHAALPTARTRARAHAARVTASNGQASFRRSRGFARAAGPTAS